MAASKQSKLDQIKADILSNNICPDLAEQATQLVFGDGNPDSDIVFIGEAPGKNEDLKGVPFVGAAGKFLDEMLSTIKLKRENIYITNIVKYRPPNNRDPLPDEKAAFLPYLKQQIDVIQPKLIVTLGRHSMDVLLPGLKISQVHGQPKRIRVRNLGRVGDQGGDAGQGVGEHSTESYKKYGEGEAEPATQSSAPNDSGESGSAGQSDVMTLVILPLFHPAAALYNGAMRQTLLDDFSLIPAIIKKINSI
jgi:uracil-DNA glycosylase